MDPRSEDPGAAPLRESKGSRLTTGSPNGPESRMPAGRLAGRPRSQGGGLSDSAVVVEGLVHDLAVAPGLQRHLTPGPSARAHGPSGRRWKADLRCQHRAPVSDADVFSVAPAHRRLSGDRVGPIRVAARTAHRPTDSPRKPGMAERGKNGTPVLSRVDRKRKCRVPKHGGPAQVSIRRKPPGSLYSAKFSSRGSAPPYAFAQNDSFRSFRIHSRRAVANRSLLRHRQADLSAGR